MAFYVLIRRLGQIRTREDLQLMGSEKPKILLGSRGGIGETSTNRGVCADVQYGI